MLHYVFGASQELTHKLLKFGSPGFRSAISNGRAFFG